MAASVVDGLATLVQVAWGARLPLMGISGMELMVIALVTLILFGPNELPEVIRTAARALRFLSRTAQEFRREVDVLMRDNEVNAVRRKVEDAIRHTDEAPLPERSARLSGTSISSPRTPHLEKPSSAPPATAARSNDPPKADGS